jgi:hypothetical protein
MSWRFRQSFKLFPGVKINVSKSGLSTTLGSGPFHLNISPLGLMQTLSIPGSGISCRHRLGGIHDSNSRKGEEEIPQWQPDGLPCANPMTSEVIQSAETEEMTSPGMDAFLSLLKAALRERREIDGLLNVSRKQYAGLRSRLDDWELGFWKKRLFPKRLALLRDEVKLNREMIDEYEQQWKQTVIQTQIDVSEADMERFDAVKETFSRLLGSEMIWDVLSVATVDKGRERSSASSSYARHRVFFSFNSMGVISSRWVVPYLGNRNGGVLYLYPGFVLYYVNDLELTVIDCKDIQIEFSDLRFIEEETVPSDAKILEYTWKKTNKDKSPDKRFKGNYQIPVCCYARMRISSKGGLREEYMISNVDAARGFYDAFSSYLKFAVSSR